jgi:nitronate monooxygenase
MLKTHLCDLFGIEVPIILAPMGTCTSAELAAAVSNEGGLGGIGSLFRTTAPSSATRARRERRHPDSVDIAHNRAAVP